LINLAKAIGRIVVSYKDVQSLAGYSTLVFEMKEVLDDLEAGKYKRLMVKSNSYDDNKEVEEHEGDHRLIKQKTTFMDNSLSN
jgi:ATP-binding cassette subfamily D (ALD) protein 3